MRRRRNNSGTASPGAAINQVLRYFQEQLADEDYAPGVSDLLRLIQYRRDLQNSRPVYVMAGWVRDANT